MKLYGKTATAVISSCFSVIVLSGSPALGQTREEGPWWPHPIWGPDDQAGASNWITPEKILEAISLVRTGQVYELGHVYERGMPLLGQRTFALFIWAAMVGHEVIAPVTGSIVPTTRGTITVAAPKL